jgi:hypothetical protein
MLVIAKVSSIKTLQATKEANPYDLEHGTLYFQCQVQQVENIVGFEGDQYGFTNYQCGAKY